MTGLHRVAAEYLAMVLPGEPAQVAALVGLPGPEVARLRREPGAARRLAGHRKRLNQYTAGDSGPIPPPLPSKGRTPQVHRAPPFGYLTPCCGKPLGRLPRADRITSDPEAVTCPG